MHKTLQLKSSGRSRIKDMNILHYSIDLKILNITLGQKSIHPINKALQ